MVETDVLRSRFFLHLSRLVCSLLLVSALVSGCARSTQSALEQASEAWDSGDYEIAAAKFERYLKNNPTGP